MWSSLHGLRINLVVVLVRSKKPDHQHAMGVLHDGNQPIVVALDVEYDPAALENARLRVSLLHVLRPFPLRLLYYGPPGIVLRSRRLDPTVAGPRREIAFHDVGADDDHGPRSYPRVP